MGATRRGPRCITQPERATLRSVALLLARGAEANVIWWGDGETPLHEALGGRYDQAAHLPIVKMLLEAGCDPNKEQSRRQPDFTPFQLALKRGARETAALLFEHGADPNRSHSYKTTFAFVAELWRLPC